VCVCVCLCVCLSLSLSVCVSLSLSGGDTNTLLLFVIVALANHLNIAVDVAAKHKIHFANFYEKREKATFSGVFVCRLQLMSELLIYRSEGMSAPSKPRNPLRERGNRSFNL
jgi:hypothetical protein